MSTWYVRLVCRHVVDKLAGDRLYVGLATGAVQVYSYEISTNTPSTSESPGVPEVKLLKTHNLSRRSIDQLGVLPETNQLLVLAGQSTFQYAVLTRMLNCSDATVTLHTLPDMAKSGTTTLAQARTAHCFDIASYTSALKSKASGPDVGSGNGESKKVKQDVLVVGCRKKVVVYGMGKKGFKEGLVSNRTSQDRPIVQQAELQELALPHSPRSVILPSGSGVPNTVHMLYSPTTSAILRIDLDSKTPLTVTDLPNTPLPPPHGSTSKDLASASTSTQPDTNVPAAATGGLGGALSGLGGYVGLGGKAAVPVGTRTFGGEVLIGRQGENARSVEALQGFH